MFSFHLKSVCFGVEHTFQLLLVLFTVVACARIHYNSFSVHKKIHLAFKRKKNSHFKQNNLISFFFVLKFCIFFFLNRFISFFYSIERQWTLHKFGEIEWIEHCGCLLFVYVELLCVCLFYKMEFLFSFYLCHSNSSSNSSYYN